MVASQSLPAHTSRNRMAERAYNPKAGRRFNYLLRDDDPRPFRAAHEAVEFARILRIEADAAMRGRAPEMPNIIGAVDRVSALEEDRVRHGGVMVFARSVKAVEGRWTIRSGWRAIAAARRRNRPSALQNAIHIDIHHLPGFAHPHNDASVRGGTRRGAGKKTGRSQQNFTHDYAQPECDLPRSGLTPSFIPQSKPYALSECSNSQLDPHARR